MFGRRERHQRDVPLREVVADVLIAYKWVFVFLGIISIIALSGVVIAVTQFGYSIPSWEIPRWVYIVFYSSLGTLIFGGFISVVYIIFFVEPDEYVLIVEHAIEGEYAEWSLSPEQWKDLTVVGGEDLYRRRAMDGYVYECRAYDEEENIAEVTWRAAAPHSKYIRWQQKVTAVEGVLSRMALEGVGAEAEATTVSVQVAKDAAAHVSRRLGDEQLPEDVNLQEMIESSMSDALEAHLDEPSTIEDELKESTKNEETDDDDELPDDIGSDDPRDDPDFDPDAVVGGDADE